MTQHELDIGEAEVRKLINAAGYGRWVSDAQCEQVAFAVIQAVDDFRKAKAAPSKP